MFTAPRLNSPGHKSGIYLGMEFRYSLDKIDEAAEWLLSWKGDRKILAFHGDLGAGKTTLIAAICRKLKVLEAVSSPTFAIINAYTTREKETIFHMDLYRIKSEQEAIDAGVEDCLISGSLCLVEWPEKQPDLFSGETHCYISIASGTERILRIIV